MALKIPYYRPVSRPRYSGFSADTIRGEAIDVSPVTDAIAQLADLWTGQLQHNREQKSDLKRGQAALDLNRITFALATDKDPATRIDRFLKARDNLRNSYLKQLEDEGLGGSEEFAQEFDRSALSEEFDLRKATTVAMQEQHEGNLELGLDNATELAGKGSYEQQEQWRKDGIKQIERAVAAGVLSPKQGVERERKFSSSIIETRVRRDILADPHEAERRLLAGEYKDLEPDDETKLLEKAGNLSYRDEQRATALAEKRDRMLDRASSAAEHEENRRWRSEQRAHTLQERAEKDTADAFERQVLEMGAKGTLTPTFIEKHAREMRPETIKWAYNELEPDTSSAATKTDRYVYAGLRDAAARGEPVAVVARDSYKAQLINREDLDRLVKMEEEGPTLPYWYKFGEKFIQDSIKVGGLRDPVTAEEKAEIQDKWWEYSRTHKDASVEDASKTYKQFVADAQGNTFTKVKSELGADSPDVAAVQKPADLDAALTSATEEMLAKHGGDEAAMMADPEFLKRMQELERLYRAAPVEEEAAGGRP